jgi:hypothetical protein
MSIMKDIYEKRPSCNRVASRFTLSDDAVTSLDCPVSAEDSVAAWLQPVATVDKGETCHYLKPKCRDGCKPTSRNVESG